MVDETPARLATSFIVDTRCSYIFLAARKRLRNRLRDYYLAPDCRQENGDWIGGTMERRRTSRFHLIRICQSAQGRRAKWLWSIAAPRTRSQLDALANAMTIQRTLFGVRGHELQATALVFPRNCVHLAVRILPHSNGRLVVRRPRPATDGNANEIRMDGDRHQSELSTQDLSNGITAVYAPASMKVRAARRYPSAYAIPACQDAAQVICGVWSGMMTPL